MRYLIIGGNGLTGKSFRKLLRGEEVYYTSREASETPGSIACDLFDTASIEKAFATARPGVVINCANLAGGVDYCEANPGTARKFHTEATQHLGELCKEHKALFIFISTDYVFDGTKPPYSEEDAKNPLNVYGKSKLEAEEWIQENLERYIIARTTNVFGWDPFTKTPNFLMGLYFKLTKGEQASAPSFLYGNPTLADNLAEAILEISRKQGKGVYHLVGSGYIDRYSWALKFAEKIGLDTSRIHEQAAPPAGIVPRPFRSNLSTAKFRKEFTTPLMDVEEGLEAFARQMEEKE